MTLLKGFLALNYVTKNHILGVEGVLDLSLLLYIKILLQNIYTYNVLQIERVTDTAPERRFG